MIIFLFFRLSLVIMIYNKKFHKISFKNVGILRNNSKIKALIIIIIDLVLVRSKNRDFHLIGPHYEAIFI